MVAKRRAGMVRRPIEYALLAVAAGLSLLAAGLFWATNRAVQPASVHESTQSEVEAGTLDDISRLAEEDITQEEALGRQYDQHEYEVSAVDATADNIGGVYDESTF